MNNLYGVDDLTWEDWSPERQRLFNEVCGDLVEHGPDLVCHPATLMRGGVRAGEEWRTVAHNAAWIAVDHFMWYLNELEERVPELVVAELKRRCSA